MWYNGGPMNHRIIPKYPDYVATTGGKIFSCKFGKRLELKQRTHRGRYKYVTLTMGGVQERFYVHRLVCAAWFGWPEARLYVNHKNGNKADNRPQNLEWVTPLENSNHAARTGTAFRKLSDYHVECIRSQHALGVSKRRLAGIFNVSRTHIRRIITGQLRTTPDAEKGVDTPAGSTQGSLLNAQLHGRTSALVGKSHVPA